MFSVYGVTGRSFKGAVADLLKVSALRPVSRVAALDANDPMHSYSGASEVPPAAAFTTSVKSPLTAYAQTVVAHMPRHALSRVADVMTRRVVTVPIGTTVLQAWQILTDQGIGQAPVVDARGLLVGLLTRGELMKPERLPLPDTNALVWRALLVQAVSEVMLSPVTAVEAEADIRHVAQVLIDNRLPGLPVVDESGTVIGFVSRTDILRAVVHEPPLDLWS